MLNKDQKADLIKGLSDSFGKAKASFLVDYKGMDVEQVTSVRKKLSAVGAELKVVRNTLAKRALSDFPAEKEALDDKLVGTNAFVFAYEEASGAAKTISACVDEFENFKFKSGVMSGSVLDQNRMKFLATLPGKDELRAKLLGTLQAPASKFVRVLNAVPGGLVNVLNAYKNQKEG